MSYLRFYLKQILSTNKPVFYSIPFIDLSINNNNINNTNLWNKNQKGVWVLNKNLVFSDHIAFNIDNKIHTFYILSAKEAGCGYNYSHIIFGESVNIVGHLFIKKS